MSLPGFPLRRRGGSGVPQLRREGQGAGHQRAQLQEGSEEVRPAVSVLPRAATGQQGPAEEVPDDGAGAGGKEEGLQGKEERGGFKLIPKLQNMASKIINTLYYPLKVSFFT